MNSIPARGKYPWDKWLLKPAGCKTTIKQEKYTSTQVSMCVAIRHQSSLRGVRHTVIPQKNGDIIIISKGPIDASSS